MKMELRYVGQALAVQDHQASGDELGAQSNTEAKNGVLCCPP
jgi:hypothetical protein